MNKHEDTVMPPKGKIEWNLNTIVTLVGFAGGLVAWGITLGTFSSEMRAYETRFNTYVNDQRVVASRNEERMRAVESDTKKTDNLAYRVTVVEQNAANTSQAIVELKSIVNSQSTDIKVMREILEQFRETQGFRRRTAGMGE